MRLATLILQCALAACAATPAAGPADTLVLHNVTVIDGTGAPPVSGVTLVIENGVITQMGSAAAMTYPASARALEVAGLHVMPGLIDAHVHLASFERPAEVVRTLLRYALMGGVTTVRDMGGNPARVAELAAWARHDSATAPMIHAAAVIAGPRWFETYDPARLRFWSGTSPVGQAPGVRRYDDTTDPAALARQADSLGATGIKVYSGIAADRLQLLFAQARQAGLRTWSHAVVPPADPLEVVTAGAQVVSHSDQLVWAARAPGETVGDRAVRGAILARTPPDAPPITAVLEAMRERGTLFEPTLLVMQAGSGVFAGPPASALDTLVAWAIGVTRRAHELGVPIVAGTDALGTETPNIHSELQLLVSQGGLSPPEAITAATRHGALALGIEDRVGTVAVGMRADLLVLDANPADDIRNTQTVRYVIRGGRVRERTEAWELPQLSSPPPRR